MNTPAWEQLQFVQYLEHFIVPSPLIVRILEVLELFHMVQNIHDVPEAEKKRSILANLSSNSCMFVPTPLLSFAKRMVHKMAMTNELKLYSSMEIP